jgi:ABC-type arginine transport system ATPase subunit
MFQVLRLSEMKRFFVLSSAHHAQDLSLAEAERELPKLRKEIDMIFRTLKLAEMPEIKIDIEEVRSPETSASIVGQMVVEGLEKRMPFRRVMKQTAEKVMANRDVKGNSYHHLRPSWWC